LPAALTARSSAPEKAHAQPGSPTILVRRAQWARADAMGNRPVSCTPLETQAGLPFVIG
jgi:hypothetical protein